MVVWVHDRLEPVLPRRKSAHVDLLPDGEVVVNILPADRDALCGPAAKAAGFLRGIGQSQVIGVNVHQAEAGLMPAGYDRASIGYSIAVCVWQGLPDRIGGVIVEG